MYDANIMKKSSRFYLKYNPDNRWSFWTGKWWSLCSEISGQFTPKLGGQFDRLFHVSAPMLLWAGTNDGNVSPEGSKSMFIALRKYKKPVVALLYDKEKHALMKPETQKDLTIKILDWFNYHLKDRNDIPWIQKYRKGAD